MTKDFLVQVCNPDQTVCNWVRLGDLPYTALPELKIDDALLISGAYALLMATAWGFRKLRDANDTINP